MYLRNIFVRDIRDLIVVVITGIDNTHITIATTHRTEVYVTEGHIAIEATNTITAMDFSVVKSK